MLSRVHFAPCMFCVFFFFFFSSRRRHTRSDRDWSSDVCSSDLLVVQFVVLAPMYFFYDNYMRRHILWSYPLHKSPISHSDNWFSSYHAKHLNRDRKSTRLNSSHDQISYAVFCLKKKKQ